MTANRPLVLLSIDPGLANLGWALVRVTGMHQLELIDSDTLKTSPGDPLIDRLLAIGTAVQDVFEHAEHRVEFIVVEDPTEQLETDREGQRKDPRALQKLCAAYGVILDNLICAADSPAALDRSRITTVPVVRWYPRTGRAPVKHNVLRDRIRERYPVIKSASEHVAFAVGVAYWWSSQVAPHIWHGDRIGVR